MASTRCNAPKLGVPIAGDDYEAHQPPSLAPSLTRALRRRGVSVRDPPASRGRRGHDLREAKARRGRRVDRGAVHAVSLCSHR